MRFAVSWPLAPWAEGLAMARRCVWPTVAPSRCRPEPRSWQGPAPTKREQVPGHARDARPADRSDAGNAAADPAGVAPSHHVVAGAGRQRMMGWRPLDGQAAASSIWRTVSYRAWRVDWCGLREAHTYSSRGIKERGHYAACPPDPLCLSRRHQAPCAHSNGVFIFSVRVQDF